MVIFSQQKRATFRRRVTDLSLSI